MKTGTGTRRHHALSHFLRTRRARLSPAQVGLTESAGKRRTPGLRREEVAVLAGIGTSWYSWLEQGRDINVSAPVARAIGRALRLDPSELRYFYQLVGVGVSAADADTDAGRDPVGHRAGMDVTRLVNGWLPSPALVLDTLWNIIELNEAARAVFGLAGDDNLLVGLFTNAVLRARSADHEWLTRVAVAEFRSGTVEHREDPALHELVEALSARDRRFADLWRTHEIMRPEFVPTAVEHPEVGRLDFESSMWQLGGLTRLQLRLYTPARGSATQAGLGALLRGSAPATVAT
ncbi:helix-turn-helix transcriptional regulator [Streptomyces sp. 4N509B]|uniref:helix-turn-helix transcriptional regulator n=1 Tax=Streptomyces sp. 4N509B TaxID=3457413 RepID=UPI003FD60BCB